MNFLNRFEQEWSFQHATPISIGTYISLDVICFFIESKPSLFGLHSTHSTTRTQQPVAKKQSDTQMPSERHAIRAWHGNGAKASKEDALLRSVDQFLATRRPLGRASATANNNNKHLTTAPPAQDDTKLQEWMKVAADLQDVVEQQQRQLEAAVGLPSTTTNSTTANNDKISQLQQLVRSVRNELERAPITPPLGRPHRQQEQQQREASNSPSKKVVVASLQDEIATLRRQLHTLQYAQQKSTIQQHEQAATLAARVESHRRGAQTFREDQEHTKSALMNAEMELQRTKGEVAALRQAVREHESSCQEQQRVVRMLVAEVETAKQRAADASRQIETLTKEKCDALQLAGDATAEAGRLEVEKNQKEGQAVAAMAAAEQSQAHAAVADARAAAAEASAATERGKRGALEAEIASLQSEMLMMQTALTEARRRNRADATSFSAQIEVLQEELTASQHSGRVARREADSAQAQVDSLSQAHAAAVAAAKAAQEKLLNVEAEVEASMRRATLAEAQAAAAKDEAAHRTTEADIEAKLSYDTEVKALKEVLDSVATAAQQKDSALQVAQAEVAEAKEQLAAMRAQIDEAQRQLAETQASASKEFKEYEKQVQEAFQAVEVARQQAAMTQPVTVVFNLQEAPIIRGWQEGDPVPASLQNTLDRELKVVKAANSVATRAAVESALAAERKEHAAAVRALEEAHMAEIEAVAMTKGIANHNTTNAPKEQQLATINEEEGETTTTTTTSGSNDDNGDQGNAAVTSSSNTVSTSTPESNANTNNENSKEVEELSPAMLLFSSPLSSQKPRAWEGSATEFRRARETAEAEAAALREEVRFLRQSGVDSQLKLRTVEGELLIEKDASARQNATIAKLEKKLKRLREKLDKAREEKAVAEGEVAGLTLLLERAEEAAKSMQAELTDAHDEVEALLNARITQLSRPASVVDGEDEEEEVEEVEAQDVDGAYDGACHPPMNGRGWMADDQELSNADAAANEMGVANVMRMEHQLQLQQDFNGVESDEDAVLMMRQNSHHPSCVNTEAEAVSVEPMAMRHSWAGSSSSSHVTAAGPLAAASSMLLVQQDSAAMMPPPPPPPPRHHVERRSSPLKKLANMLRGRKRRDASGSTGGEVENTSVHHHHDDGGAVRRSLMRGPDGSVQWQPQQPVGQQMAMPVRGEGGLHAEYSEGGDMFY